MGMIPHRLICLNTQFWLVELLGKDWEVWPCERGCVSLPHCCASRCKLLAAASVSFLPVFMPAAMLPAMVVMDSNPLKL